MNCSSNFYKVPLCIIYLFKIIMASDFLEIDVITTNDLRGVIEPQKAYFMNPSYPPDIIGGAGFARYLKDFSEKKDFLLVDAGNFYRGSTLGMADSGRTMVEWMNLNGYDALVPGQEDFIFGVDNINTLADLAKFPFLASNIKSINGKNLSTNIKPFTIKEINGVNIGLIGIVDTKIPDLSLNSNVLGIEFLKSVPTLHKNIRLAKSSGADIIILLTSMGIPYDRDEKYKDFIDKIIMSESNEIEPLNSIELGYYAYDVDVIISGGVSKGYPNPWYDPYTHVYSFQNYGGGTEFGHIILRIDPDSELLYDYKLGTDGRVGQSLLADDFRPDIESNSWINKKKNNLVYNPNLIINKIPQNIELTNNWEVDKHGTNDGFEIMTWNWEFFPTASDSTITALSEIINDLDLDIIAIQEIRKMSYFENLMNMLPQYNAILSQNSSFLHQAIIYKYDQYNAVATKELFIDNDYNFAGRPPLFCTLQNKSSDIILNIANIHMKCCDSGLNRRKKASAMLYDYIISRSKKQGINEHWIVLGDWNDDLKDNLGEHCFDPFLDNENFVFVTESIVYDYDQASYPKEPYHSFLDHILVSKNFIKGKNYKINTIRVDKMMGGYDVYEEYISDHLPVLLSLPGGLNSY